MDVAELFNIKAKSKYEDSLELKVEVNLDRCPDKNAKISLELTGYMKSEISSDAISQASTRTTTIPEKTETPAAELNFKKKKKEPMIVEN